MKLLHQAVAGYLNSYSEQNSEDVAHAMRLLRLPSNLRKLSKFERFVQTLAAAFVPDQVNLKRAGNLLRQCGTLEGRLFLFRNYVKPTFSGANNIHESKSLDIALTWFEPRKLDEAKGLAALGSKRLRIAAKFKLKRFGDIPAALKHHISHRSVDKLWMLVSLRVVRTTDELFWVTLEERSAFHDEQLEASERQEIFEVISVLKAASVERELVAKVITDPKSRCFDASKLRDNILELVKLNINVRDMVNAVGDGIWRATPAHWQLLASCTGAKRAEDFAKFSRTLCESKFVSAVFIAALRQAGASLDDLAKSERLLHAVMNARVADVHLQSATSLLAAPPFNLRPAEMLELERYFRDDRKLATFLPAIAQFGMTSAEALQLFQKCYESAAGPHVVTLIPIAQARLGSAPLAKLVDWVDAAGRQGYIGELRFLLSKIQIVDLPGLFKALKILVCGPALLSFLIDDKGLKTISALEQWYYSATGILGNNPWVALTPLNRCLLEDAWTRKKYGLLTANRKFIFLVATEAAEAKIGPQGFNYTEEAVAAYNQLRDEQLPAIYEQVVKFLPLLLGQTRGVLTTGLLRAGLQGPTALNSALEALNPLLDDLTSGGGPIEANLSSIEAEAIALVYGTDVNTVQRHWPCVVGIHNSLPLTDPDPRPMTWAASRHDSTEEFDYAGVQLLLQARIFADEFMVKRKQGMLAARHPLRTRVLTKAAERKDVVQHLGVLLALTDGAPAVEQWTARAFESLRKLTASSPELYPEVLRLRKFFSEDLVEALARQGASSIGAMSDDEARLLAERLGFRPEHGQQLSGRQKLTDAVKRTSGLVLALFQRWTAAEESKFKLLSVQGVPLQLSAVVTKHPAAFMARTGMGLCTSADYEMWIEPRHAHLVVFDTEARRMAGFAYLFVEHLPSVDAERRGIVIRAINTDEDFLAEYSAKSIIAEFFRVVIELAEHNGLAHVCFCPPGGMHLMSNRTKLEDAVKSDYVKAAKRGRLVDRKLQPGPSIHQPVEVEAKFSAYSEGHEVQDKLYVIWTGNAA